MDGLLSTDSANVQQKQTEIRFDPMNVAKGLFSVDAFVHTY